MTSADDAASGDNAPAWISVGKKLHWWSESQKKNMSVVVAKVDNNKKLVYVTFEVDKNAYKSVPFAKIGKKDCPLRNPDEREQIAKKSAEDGSATKSKEKKRKDSERDRSATPDWWSKEQMQLLDDKKAKREQLKEEEKRKEEERKREEQKRRALVEAERKKVQEAFEKRKREAQEQKLKEEEEWRQNLVKRRAEEAAEEEARMQEKEERRKKRREEKEKKEKEKRDKDIAEGVAPPPTPPTEPPPLPGQMVPPLPGIMATHFPGQMPNQPVVVPAKVGMVNPPPPPMAAVVPVPGMPGVQPWQWQGAPQMQGMTAQSPQMPVGTPAMHLMGMGQAPPCGTNQFAFGAWGAMGNATVGAAPSQGMQMLPAMGIAAGDGCSIPGIAQWGSQWTGASQAGGQW